MRTSMALLLLSATSIAQAVPYLETFQGMSGAVCDPTKTCVSDTADHAFFVRWQNKPPAVSASTTTGFRVKTGWAEVYPADPNATMAVTRLTFTVNALAAPATAGTVTLSIWDPATGAMKPYKSYTILPNRPKTVYFYASNAPQMQALKKFQLSATNPVTTFTINAMNADLY